MKLAAWMEKKRLIDEDVAALVNCNRATINRLRRGERRPSWRLVDEIARVTNGKVTAKDWNGTTSRTDM